MNYLFQGREGGGRGGREGGGRGGREGGGRGGREGGKGSRHEEELRQCPGHTSTPPHA